nr:hypothetical protein [Tanacetum cinerariifolium]
MVDIAGFCALSVAQETTCVENIRLRRELEDVEIRYTLIRMGRERVERERDLPLRGLALLLNYATKKIKGSYLNKRSKRAAVEKLIADRVAEAIAEHERNRPNLANARGSGNVQGCSHKTFMNGKPHPFNGTEDAVGLRRWIEKIEQNEFKTMMTTKYCPATEIQRMEQEHWTLILKGDGIEAYNNRFHEIALMCSDLVPTKKKKIERYIKGFPERIIGNITSSKPTTLHDAINMARELNPNVVTCTFLLNDHYACILFDSGAEKSFVSSAFTPYIDIAPATLNTSYEVDLADGQVIVGIPLPNGEILEVHGEKPKKDPRLLSCIKANEKKLEDIRIVCNFPEVFPNELLGLPPMREIEFRIDLIHDTFPVVKPPYQLAHSEVIELSNQLKELQENGFIRPSHSQFKIYNVKIQEDIERGPYSKKPPIRRI